MQAQVLLSDLQVNIQNNNGLKKCEETERQLD